MKIVIGSEGMGIWGKKLPTYILKKMNYTDIQYKNSDECDIIISGLRFPVERRWNTQKKLYIYWSGESYPPPRNNNETKHLYILTTINPGLNNYLYYPYVLNSPYLYKDRKYANIDRPFFLAYCNKNRVKKREEIFNLFVEEKGVNLCHSLGNNCGNYPQTKKPRVAGDWNSSELMNAYKNYTFVIAMENKCVNGYVTEKILNAFYSGAIPIYWGSQNINDFFNPKAFINVNDFNSPEECVQFVTNMSKEDIKKMTEEKIYNENNEVINILNDDYNNNNNNKTLENYINIFKNFMEN